MKIIFKKQILPILILLFCIGLSSCHFGTALLSDMLQEAVDGASYGGMSGFDGGYDDLAPEVDSIGDYGPIIPIETPPVPFYNVDIDLDGYTYNEGDCNEADVDINPGAEEICGDGIDQDCDTYDLSCDDADEDGDGYSGADGDCDDDDATINPGESEITGDGIDQDCDGLDDDDTDGDGYSIDAGDCDDDDATINPGEAEVCEDGVDNDCSDGDAECEEEDELIDSDGDGVTDGLDNCPDVYNPAQTDDDANGVGDDCEEGDADERRSF